MIQAAGILPLFYLYNVANDVAESPEKDFAKYIKKVLTNRKCCTKIPNVVAKNRQSAKRLQKSPKVAQMLRPLWSKTTVNTTFWGHQRA